MNFHVDPNSKNSRQMMMAINGLLILLIIWAALIDVFNIKPPTRHLVSTPTRVAAPKNDLQQLPSWHLFGPLETATTVPKTTLNLGLSGVFADSNAKNARAAISVNGQDAKLFNISQTIMPGVTLSKVFKTKIYINNQGRTEQLDMKLQYPSLQTH